jgi:hypothetical protein
MRRLSLALLAAAIAATLPAAAPAQEIRFRAPVAVGLDKLPETIAVGDLNHDDHADVVVTHYLEGSVTVLLGTGQSSFAPAGEFFTRVGGIRAYIADLDGDGNVDLIVSYDESDDINVLRGNGDGTFGPAQRIDPGHDPVGVAVADVDGDQRLDLTVALSDEAGGYVSVIRNLGDMQFERIQYFGVATDAVEVVVHDFDQDGRPDAAVSNPESDALTLLRGIGGGMFEPAGEVEVGNGAQLLALADVDADGLADVIAARNDVSLIGVLRSRGDGSFDDVVTYLSGGRALNGMVAADVNGDSVVDIVASHLRSKSAAVLLGAGDGSFAEPVAFTSGANPVEVGVADFNGDGRADVVSANEGVDSAAPSLTLLLGDGTGRFLAPEQLLAAASPVGAAVGDFNGDAVADAVVGSENPAGLVIFPGARGALSTSSFRVPLEQEPEEILAADVDDDGWTDVVTLSGDEVGIVFADGAGALSAAAVRLPLPAAAGAVAASDLDGDGDADLVASAAGAPLAFYFLRNDGGRAFAAPLTIATTVQPSAMVAADLDGDGRGDLITNDVQNRIFLFTGPALEPLGNLLVQGIAGGLATGDVDGNSAADVIGVSPTARRLVTFLNDGAGTFAPTAPPGLGFSVAVTLRDLDGDAAAEAITADQLSGETIVLRNEGSGAWRPLDPVVSGDRLAALAAGDFDDDGHYDIVATGSNVCRLINETPGSAAARGDGNGDTRVTAADFVAAVTELLDGDGQQVESVGRGTFAASAGVDADGDGVIGRADLRALLLRLL